MKLGLAIVLIDDAGEEVNEENIISVLHSAGYTDDEINRSRVKAAIAALEDVDIGERLEQETEHTFTGEPDVSDDDENTTESSSNVDDDGDDDGGKLRDKLSLGS